MRSQEVIQKKICVSRVKFIERYGVSVYDEDHLPDEIQDSRFVWKCTLVTRNKNLINIIQSAIQNWEVKAAHKRRLSFRATPYAKGDIVCSLLRMYALNQGLPDEMKGQKI